MRNNQRDQVSIGAQGRVTYRQRFVGDFSSYHNPSNCPFDHHVFDISFVPVERNADEPRFLPDPQKTWIADRLNIEGWHISGIALGESGGQLREAGHPLSLLTLAISAEREVNYYLFRIVLPLFFVVAIS